MKKLKQLLTPKQKKTQMTWNLNNVLLGIAILLAVVSLVLVLKSGKNS